MSLLNLPELLALESARSVIRIPPEIDVPVTQRVMRLIDTKPFRRLAKISQLGLVAQVYPGATHTRFEHSLGVYRLALLYLRSLAVQADFAERVDEDDSVLFHIAVAVDQFFIGFIAVQDVLEVLHGAIEIVGGLQSVLGVFE